MRSLVRLIILMIGLVLFTITLIKNYPDVLNNNSNLASLISTLLLLTFLIFKISFSEENFSTTIKQIFIWMGIIFFILIGYSYKNEINSIFNQTLANLLPGHGQVQDQNTVVFYASNNGHFTINALVNDEETIDFLLDTGASTVSLTFEDANRLGIDTDSLVYNTPFNTANGITWSAEITLDQIQIGSIIVNKVPASISQKGASINSLLGMSFLNRLSSFKIESNKLTLIK